jgi:hypothetical protein
MSESGESESRPRCFNGAAPLAVGGELTQHDVALGANAG